MGRVAAIDFGKARIGLAISDERKVLASAKPNIPTQKKLPATVDLLVTTLSSYSIEQIVVGHPLKLDGSSSSLTEEVLQFVELLKTKVSCPVVLMDERLTTSQAEKALREGLSRKKRSKVIDGAAATILLQNFLEYAHSSASYLPHPTT